MSAQKTANYTKMTAESDMTVLMRIPFPTRSHLVEYFMCDCPALCELMGCVCVCQSGTFIQKERMAEGEGYQRMAGSEVRLIHVPDHL